MRICVIHLGSVRDCFVASSVNNGFRRKYGKADVTWVVQDDEQARLMQSCEFPVEVMPASAIKPTGDYDLLVNFSPSVHPSDPILTAKERLGFNFSEDSAKYYEVLHGEGKIDMSLFQLYFRLAGMTWRGESYGIKYYPKSKCRKNTAAIAVDHLKLRHYVEDRLDLKGMRVYSLPFRKSVFKRMDDLNRHEYVITDDSLTMHLAVYLRKHVHYLETLPTNTRPEFFGKGHVYRVPPTIVA